MAEHPRPAPTSSSHHLEALAEAFKEKGHLDQALECYEKALREEPDSAGLLYKLANLLVTLGRPRWAVPYYKQALVLEPRAHEILYNLATTLGHLGDYQAARGYYQRCLRLVPEFAPARHGLGTALMALGELEQAVAHFQRALELDPGFDQARRDLHSAYRLLVPRWHFAMLNDQERNQAFQQALEKAVTPRTRVLDIGTGSGLLALMAARAGACRVTACESLPVMAHMARRIVEGNGMADRITVVAKASQDLRLGRDLPQPADLLVTEIFDAGLLGEKVIPTIRHAREHLLAPGATIIPRAARIKARLVQSRELWLKDRVPDQVAGFDLSPFNQFSNALYFSAPVTRFQHRWLSDPFEVFSYDFTRDLPLEQKSLLKIRATHSGTCHAVVFWFQLHLDQRISLETKPGRGGHWAQAVQALPKPISLGKGHKLVLLVEQHSRGVSFEPRGVQPPSLTALDTKTPRTTATPAEAVA